MFSAQTSSTNGSQHLEDDGDQETEQIRDIHALTPPPPVPSRGGTRWDSSSHRSMSISSELGAPSENFTTMSREFNALVIAGSAIGESSINNNPSSSNNDDVIHGSNTLLGRIREDDLGEETNPLAIVPGDNNLSIDPEPSSRRSGFGSGQMVAAGEMSVQRVKKEEVETKISAWQNAKIAKINNRYKREDAVINGWESEQVQKASSWMKKVEVRT